MSAGEGVGYLMLSFKAPFVSSSLETYMVKNVHPCASVIYDRLLRFFINNCNLKSFTAVF